jgi:hypothetical protein
VKKKEEKEKITEEAEDQQVFLIVV